MSHNNLMSVSYKGDEPKMIQRKVNGPLMDGSEDEHWYTINQLFGSKSLLVIPYLQK